MSAPSEGIDFSAPLALMNGRSHQVYLTRTHTLVNLLVEPVDISLDTP